MIGGAIGSVGRQGSMTTSRRQALVTAAIVVLTLGGCTVGPNYSPPAAPTVDHYLPTALPASTGAGDGAQRFVAGKALDERWWSLFGSSALDALETEALANNADVAAAQAALRQADELVLAQRAANLPNVGLEATASRVRNAGVLASPLSSNAQSYSLFGAQLNVAYLVDLFGGQRRQVEALAAQAEFQRFQADAVYLTLTANVASTALQIASLNSQRKALTDAVESYQRVLDVTRRMQAQGELSTLDVASAQSALEQAEQPAAGLDKQVAQLQDLLAVYLGRSSADAPQLTQDLSDLQLPAELPVSLPSDLVRQRPDVRAAAANLHAASAAVGVAVAARLPSFNLNGSLGGASTALQSLLASDNVLWSVGAAANQTVFDAGAGRRREKAAEAGLEQAKAQYRGAVLVAFQSMADVLQAVVQDAETLRAASRAEVAASRSAKLAQSQFEHGQAGSLPALNAAAVDRQAQLAVIQARTTRYTDTVALMQALGGGGWNSEKTTVVGAR